MIKMRIGRTILAVVLLLVLAATPVLWFVSYRATAVPIDTYHSSWHLIRASAAEDAADFATTVNLAGAGGDFASMPTAAFNIPSRYGGPGEGYSPGGAWMFVFGGTDADGDTFSFNIVGWGRLNGMAQVICEGNGILGAQDIVLYPHDSSTATNGFWADTITLDETTKWPSVAVYNSADNEVCFVLVDMTGLEYVYPVIYDASGTAEASTIVVYGRRY